MFADEKTPCDVVNTALKPSEAINLYKFRVEFSKKRGFTLVELVSVLVLVAIIGAVALNRIAPSSAFQLQSSRDTIVAAFFSAQQKAMAQRNAVQLIAGSSSIDVRIDSNSDGNFDNSESAFLGGVQYPLSLIGSQSLISSGSRNFNFDRLGRTSSATLTLSQNGNSVQISISTNGSIN